MREYPKDSRKYCVLDTSSILRILRSSKPLQECIFIIPSIVLKEIKDVETKFLLETGKIAFSVIEPAKKSIEDVVRIANQLGLSNDLSRTDISVIATALDLIRRGHEVIVFTEDYGIQNLCAYLGIEFESVIDRKIKVVLRAYKKCKICGEVFNPVLLECPSCGSKDFIIIRKRVSRLNTKQS
ncbi:MAG: NOB1 family endonuclease [Candidatus Njordarchaeales archaeon]